jgi:hypothetical protein
VVVMRVLLKMILLPHCILLPGHAMEQCIAHNWIERKRKAEQKQVKDCLKDGAILKKMTSPFHSQAFARKLKFIACLC